ncbi:MAG: hypothetical protein ACE5IZ_08330, partial [Dehalococcoidia bacterium]
GQGESEGFASEQEYQRTLAEALTGIDQEFTIEEALRVLEVLEQRLQGSRFSSVPQPDPAYRDW